MARIRGDGNAKVRKGVVEFFNVKTSSSTTRPWRRCHSWPMGPTVVNFTNYACQQMIEISRIAVHFKSFLVDLAPKSFDESGALPVISKSMKVRFRHECHEPFDFGSHVHHHLEATRTGFSNPNLDDKLCWRYSIFSTIKSPRRVATFGP